jgi:hypothetical protein
LTCFPWRRQKNTLHEIWWKSDWSFMSQLFAFRALKTPTRITKAGCPERAWAESQQKTQWTPTLTSYGHARSSVCQCPFRKNVSASSLGELSYLSGFYRTSCS